MAVELQEMDERVTFQEQLQQDTGPVVLINRFNVAPEDAEKPLASLGRGCGLYEAATGLHLHPTPPRHRRKHHLHQPRGMGIGPGACPRIRVPRIPSSHRPLPRQRSCRTTPVREGGRRRNLRRLTPPPVVFLLTACSGASESAVRPLTCSWSAVR
jgi:hypothetical protein